MLALWRQSLGNWRATQYDCMVQPPFCTKDFTSPEGFKVNDCGDPFMSILFHVSFQIFSTFAVLNVVIAIILGAFTWCYSLEQSELTSGLAINADHLRHLKAIWDRFDLYSEGHIDIKRLQVFLAVVRYVIPEFFCTGTRTQQGELLYKDYSSFGFSEKNGEPETLKERKCRENYEDLVRRMGDFERSAELWKQLDMAGCDVWTGCNDNVAGFDIKLHPLGSKDEDLHIFTKEVNNGIISCPAWQKGEVSETTVERAKFMTLINIMIIEPLNLSPHDVYVCFDYKDPFSYFQPGYFGDKYPVDGQVVLETDPQSIRSPLFKPAFYKSDQPKLTQDDMAGVYTVNKPSDHSALIDDAPAERTNEPDDHKKKTSVVTKQRGIA